MEEKYRTILASVYANKKTLENYESRMRALLKNVPANLQTILENPDTYYPTIQKAYPSLTTRKKGNKRNKEGKPATIKELAQVRNQKCKLDGKEK